MTDGTCVTAPARKAAALACACDILHPVPVMPAPARRHRGRSVPPRWLPALEGAQLGACRDVRKPEFAISQLVRLLFWLPLCRHCLFSLGHSRFPDWVLSCDLSTTGLSGARRSSFLRGPLLRGNKAAPTEPVACPHRRADGRVVMRDRPLVRADPRRGAESLRRRVLRR